MSGRNLREIDDLNPTDFCILVTGTCDENFRDVGKPVELHGDFWSSKHEAKLPVVKLVFQAGDEAAESAVEVALLWPPRPFDHFGVESVKFVEDGLYGKRYGAIDRKVRENIGVATVFQILALWRRRRSVRRP